jgi:8-oxo-dGTP diphosphatase
MRRFGEPVRPNVRYRQRPGAYAVLSDGARLLLTHQEEPQPEYQLPGGGIDPGESALTALHREVFEETGWTIHAARRIGAYQRLTYMPEYDLWARKVCHVYLARPALRRGPPLEAGHRAVWAAPDEALALLDNSGDRHFAHRALSALGLA